MRLTLLYLLVASLSVVSLGAAVSPMAEPLNSLAQRGCISSGQSCIDSHDCCSKHCYLLDNDPQTCAVSHEVEV